jgi:hypothetical protein
VSNALPPCGLEFAHIGDFFDRWRGHAERITRRHLPVAALGDGLIPWIGGSGTTGLRTVWRRPSLRPGCSCPTPARRGDGSPHGVRPGHGPWATRLRDAHRGASLSDGRLL